MHCGIKAKAAALDLAMLAADTPASAAALFTTNLAQAAPVIVSKRHLERTQGIARAIVVNSGCANACTGDDGLAHARTMAVETAAAVGCTPEEVLVASTGVIGVTLKIDRVVAGIRTRRGALSPANGSEAARAIMTTDPFPKEHAVTVDTPQGSFTVGGMAKGSGMIEPNMATMLGFLTTDAQVPPALLRRALAGVGARHLQRHHRRRRVLDQRLAVCAGVRRERRRRSTSDSYPALLEGLLAVSRELALGIVRGGEGATKLIAVTVTRRPDDRRRPAGGANDRQFAAGEDRGARRRPELGTHRRGRGPLGRDVRRRPGDRARRRDPALRKRPAA